MITSPCTGVCTMDPETGWCAGCARTRDEIAGWGTRSPDARAAVWAALPERLDRLGVTLRRPDWDEESIRETVLDRLRHGAGHWALAGCGGFAQARLHDTDAEAEGAMVSACDGDSALKLRINKHVRAFRCADPGRAGDALIVSVLRTRLADERRTALTELGPDEKAILPSGRGAILFDLGVESEAARFMLRSADPALVAALRRLEGAPWRAALAEAAEALDAAPPTRVVQSFGGRLETDAPLMRDGPFPAALARSLEDLREAPAPLDPGAANAPVAIHRAEPAA
jgi:predicted Fe-S protein YdhL (DUF1289 family)